MLADLWKGLGGSLLDRFTAVAVPAVLFWLGGSLAWLHAVGSTARLEQTLGWLGERPVPVQLAVVGAVVAAVAAGGLVVASITTPVLRVLEGYWPRWTAPVRDRLVTRHRGRARALQRTWDGLQPAVESGTADARGREEFGTADARLRDYPDDDDRFLPTRVGNMLRASETRPVDRYGLDPVRCWAALWLVLPETARAELSAARTAMDSAVRALVWALLFLVWTPLAWWAPVVAVVVAGWIVVVLLPARARTYGAVLEAVVDVHRRALYDALCWPLPGSPAEEREVGAAVTEYLWRGSDSATPAYRAG